MKTEKTELEEVFVVIPEVFEDERGYFMESFSQRKLKEVGITDQFVQDNHIQSVKKGVIRGIHYQNHPHAQAKLLRCTCGAVMDYAVDLRKNSPTYKKWVCVELTAENKKQIYIPQGFGHAVISLSEISEIQYKVNNFFDKESDGTIAYNDPELQIKWPFDAVILSEKDKNAPLLVDSNCNY